MCEMELRGCAMGRKWCGVVTFDIPCPSAPLSFAPNMGGVWLTPRAPFQRSVGRRFLYGLRWWLYDPVGSSVAWWSVTPATERTCASIRAATLDPLALRASAESSHELVCGLM